MKGVDQQLLTPLWEQHIPVTWTKTLTFPSYELETYDSKNDTAENRDSIVGQVYAQIMQIESRLLPCGKTV